MPYITDKSFENWIDVPFTLPQTQLLGNEWFIVGSLCLLEGMSFEFRQSQLRLIDSSGLAATGNITLSLIQSFNPSIAPWLQGTPSTSNPALLVEPALLVAYPYNCNAAIAARDVTSPLEVTQPGLYSLVLGFQLTSALAATDDPLTAETDVAVTAQGRLVFGA